MKRKRKSPSAETAFKKPKTAISSTSCPTAALLRQYYPHVSTLREYLVSRLSKGSKQTSRHLLRYGDGSQPDDDAAVVQLLDKTLIGCFDQSSVVNYESIDHDITVFTQQLSECSEVIGPTQGAFKQSETVDFVIWSLFQRQHSWRRPAHILCHGYQRTTSPGDGGELEIVPSIPGILSSCTNPYVQTLKGKPWSMLPSLLGRKAELIIGGMLIQAGVFTLIDGSSNLIQLSGTPMSDLKPQVAKPANEESLCREKSRASTAGRSHTEILFVRHRMLYARPSLTSRGQPRVGPNHLHVLNRLRKTDDDTETVQVMKYIFPRQFGLHNVFTSDVDPAETAMRFKDYTLREKEIMAADQRAKRKVTTTDPVGMQSKPSHLPKRLRGAAFRLVQSIRRRHMRCPYHALLQHYCPRRVSGQAAESSSIRNASTPVEVSAFCRAVVLHVFPNALWGSTAAGAHNRTLLLRKVDQFVRLRRYETMSVHDVLQGVKIRDVDWLAPPSLDNHSNLSSTDFSKRGELMAEVLYYLFDSFLIPLIRGTFHVTESNVHRNQLFYFRHDDWKAMTEPALSSLKAGMLEECSAADVRKMLAKRALGVSQVRLLPKESGMRPIINLRRRAQRLQHGQMVLGKSINSLLTPAFSVLNFEKAARPEMLGSALFSVDDIFPRLQAFKDELQRNGHGDSPLYFAKVDVQSCFDTIPQKRLMALASTIIRDDSYRIAKYARAKLVSGQSKQSPGFGARPSWKFLTKASASSRPFSFANETATDTNEGRSRTVYIDNVVQRAESRKAVLDLLEEHVQANLIRIDKRYYRQKRGIPQGSIVSSLLCSYLYAGLERDVLGFLAEGQTLLLRLIDDFLVISTDRSIAERFMHVMHAGIPEYGVQVKAEKSRANFDVLVQGKAIARLPQHSDFAYCGHAINTVTLDLSKDHERRRKTNIADSVTVDFSRLPGQTFYRKTLNAVKLQMHAMLLSTKYNSVQTVWANLYHSFSEIALKSYHYIHSLPAGKEPGEGLVVRTLDEVVKLACVLMKRRKRTSKDVLPYECCASNGQARW
ncbi:Telomerase reverse transcriptase [Friedmanniomyces endolithicus]|nr:Telomerase reverse transcriptase [Friedmanniomyces endolithicus]KAK0922344.1 Telomerase reverse transcriptase [Friedmanniomyces endolithicus]